MLDPDIHGIKILTFEHITRIYKQNINKIFEWAINFNLSWFLNLFELLVAMGKRIEVEFISLFVHPLIWI